jgi:hypothetical protein
MSYSVDTKSVKKKIRVLGVGITSVFLLGVIIIYFGINIFPNSTYFNSLTGKYADYQLSFSYPGGMKLSTTGLLAQYPDMNSGMVLGTINKSGVVEILLLTWVTTSNPPQPILALQACYQEFEPYLPNSVMNYNLSQPAWTNVQGYPSNYENFTFTYNSAIFDGVVQTWYDPTSHRIYGVGFLSDTTDWATVYNGIISSFRGH